MSDVRKLVGESVVEMWADDGYEALAACPVLTDSEHVSVLIKDSTGIPTVIVTFDAEGKLSAGKSMLDYIEERLHAYEAAATATKQFLERVRQEGCLKC